MLLALFHEVDTYIIAFLISFPRVLGFLSTALIFSASTMTRLGRNSLICVLCLPLAPLNYAGIHNIQLDPGPVILLVFKEYAIGFCLGYAIGWIFWSVQAAGSLIDNQRGASIAESVDPLQGHQSSPLGNLFSQAITVYLFLTNGILLLVGILYQSFLLWPVWNYVPVIKAGFPALFLSILDNGMRLAFIYAAPVVIIMFLAEASLAMISRFAPQIQVFILAMPIKSGLAIMILVFYTGVLFPHAGGKPDEAWSFVLQFFETIDIQAGGAP